MKIYVVMQSWGEYEDYTEVIIGVVSSMEKAKELAMNAKPIRFDISFVEVECFELDGGSEGRTQLNQIDEAVD